MGLEPTISSLGGGALSIRPHEHVPCSIRHRCIVAVPIQVVMAAGWPTTPQRGQCALTHVWIGHHAAKLCGPDRGSVFRYPAAPTRATLCATHAAFFTDRVSGAGWHLCGTGHGMPMLMGTRGDTNAQDIRNQHQQSQSCQYIGNVRPDGKHSVARRY